MKSILKKIINLFGYEIFRINKELKNNLSFDQIYQLNFKNNQIVFDVGANLGQSIKRFKKTFKSPIIHSFEPNYIAYSKLQNLYGNDKNIFLNNFALGEKNCYKKFNISHKSDTSSFYNFKKNSRWILKRSKDLNLTPHNFVKEKVDIKVMTLDNYCNVNKVNKIDILKIDTQGYESKVLEGAKHSLKKNMISALEIEMILDDVYEIYNSFSDIEKNLVKNKYRLVAIDKGGDGNNNLFEGLVFFCDVIYFSKSQLNKNIAEECS
jgi:FkbM family methyltransferase